MFCTLPGYINERKEEENARNLLYIFQIEETQRKRIYYFM